MRKNVKEAILAYFLSLSFNKKHIRILMQSCVCFMQVVLEGRTRPRISQQNAPCVKYACVLFPVSNHDLLKQLLRGRRCVGDRIRTRCDRFTNGIIGFAARGDQRNIWIRSTDFPHNVRCAKAAGNV